ncbi:transmembrane protein 214-A-like [Saccoglossus kowalevskii]|uniref:Transmembrane protein 214-B-like n=1 Tax=Saccoglossus kowalevskii TaxID=10224 RepID=A0ABM0MLP1_SACKO|nr:PREDICTED: transmembrane protein 214-B-like [Saccoglossus kowalevskii]
MCLSTDPHCFSVWCQMYTSHMEQSNVLMNHLLLTWNTISNKLPLNTLRDTVRAFSVTNDELTGKSNQTPYLNQCQRVCKELMAKMTAAKFPWKYMVLLLMTGMVALVTYDIYRYRGFHGSKTDLFLEESGVKTASVQAWNKVTLYSAKANIWMKDNIPYYYSKACEFSEPYLQLLWEKLYQAGVYLAEVTKPQRQWIDEKIPLVLAWIEEWIPIVLASVRYYVSEAWLFLVYYITLLWNNVSPYLHTTGTWLQENVFVGKLSQESISDGLNVTWNVVQNYTIAFRHWCSEMMSTVATE